MSTTNNLAVQFVCLGCGHEYTTTFKGDRNKEQSGFRAFISNIMDVRIKTARAEYITLSGCENNGKAVLESKLPDTIVPPRLNEHISAESTDEEVIKVMNTLIKDFKSIAANTTENGIFVFS